MDPDELQTRLTAFCRAKTGDATARVSDIEVMPGHAGFSWGFTLHSKASPPPLRLGALRGDQGVPADIQREGAGLAGGAQPRSVGGSEPLVLRLPPPGVRWVGTADVVRQARVMQALARTDVPVPAVRWTGDDLQWFERPYFVVERLPGDTLRFRTPAGEPMHFEADALHRMARQVTAVLAALHRMDWQTVVPDWGPPPSLEEEVKRWDWLLERNQDPSRTSDPSLTARAPAVRERLLAHLPAPAGRGATVLHGDYQWSNHLFHEGRLLAVLDWELAGVGAPLMDLGWLALFSDLESWVGLMRWEAPLPGPDDIVAMYEETAGGPARDITWYRALAGYKFALITGLNLSLHRRGRRLDPHWEDLAPSAPRLLERAIDLMR